MVLPSLFKKPAKPTTTIIAISGNTERTLSTLPLLVVSVLSVTNALNEASFAVLPKNVMTQSMITIIVPAIIVLLATILNLDAGFKNAKAMMDMPHKIYPKDINAFLLPSLSLNAPINNVVSVAAAALAAVMIGMNTYFCVQSKTYRLK